MVIVRRNCIICGYVQKQTNFVCTLNKQPLVLNKQSQIHQLTQIFSHQLNRLLAFTKLKGLANIVITPLKVIFHNELKLIISLFLDFTSLIDFINFFLLISQVFKNKINVLKV